MQIDELAALLPRMEGALKDVMADMAQYPELDRITVQGIRKTLGFTAGSSIKLTKEQREQMVNEYKSGEYSIRALAKKYNICYSAARQIMRCRHIPIQKDDFWNMFKLRQLQNLRKKGMSYAEIGKVMNRSGSAIAQMTKKLPKKLESLKTTNG